MCWFSIYGKMPKLLEQYEWYSLQKNSSYNNVQQKLKKAGAALVITITSYIHLDRNTEYMVCISFRKHRDERKENNLLTFIIKM